MGAARAMPRVDVLGQDVPAVVAERGRGRELGHRRGARGRAQSDRAAGVVVAVRCARARASSSSSLTLNLIRYDRAPPSVPTLLVRGLSSDPPSPPPFTLSATTQVGSSRPRRSTPRQRSGRRAAATGSASPSSRATRTRSSPARGRRAARCSPPAGEISPCGSGSCSRGTTSSASRCLTATPRTLNA